MPYVLQVIHIKDEVSEKPLYETDNFPDEIKYLREVYWVMGLRPTYRANKGTFNKIVEPNKTTLEYIFETEEQARNFYKVFMDDSHPIKKKIVEMVKKLPKERFSKTKRSIVLKGPDGNILDFGVF